MVLREQFDSNVSLEKSGEGGWIIREMSNCWAIVNTDTKHYHKTKKYIPLFPRVDDIIVLLCSYYFLAHLFNRRCNFEKKKTPHRHQCLQLCQRHVCLAGPQLGRVLGHAHQNRHRHIEELGCGLWHRVCIKSILLI